MTDMAPPTRPQSHDAASDSDWISNRELFGAMFMGVLLMAWFALAIYSAVAL